jgi:DNA mismatch repair protein MutS2
MPDAIIEQASTLLDPDEVRAEALLQDIRRRRDEADRLLAQAAETVTEADERRRAAERERREAERERQEARAEALTQAEAELAEVRETLRRLQRDRETVAVTREHVETRRLETEQAAETVRQFRRTRLKPRVVSPDARTIRAGDRVRIVALDQEGEVVAVADDQADIMLGSLKTRQPLAALERVGRAAPETGRRVVYAPAAAAPVSIELDLRGFRAAEVEEMLDRYLENAYRSGLPFVRIIHGKGTGALRQVVRDILNNHPSVASHQLAPRKQGGDGATVATLRQDS